MISSDPNATADYWLPSEDDKPQEQRQVFICRYMTWNEHKRIDALLKLAAASTDGDTEERHVRDILGIGIVGWRNIDGAFSVDAIFDKFTPREICILATEYHRKVRLSERDLKNFDSPLPCSGGAAAVVESQTAATLATNCPS